MPGFCEDYFKRQAKNWHSESQRGLLHLLRHSKLAQGSYNLHAVSKLCSDSSTGWPASCAIVSLKGRAPVTVLPVMDSSSLYALPSCSGPDKTVLGSTDCMQKCPFISCLMVSQNCANVPLRIPTILMESSMGARLEVLCMI